MKFRTETELPRSTHRIAHGDGGVMLLGSCFSDNIGQRLCDDGFDVCHNPMGPLYNPASLHAFISRLLALLSAGPVREQSEIAPPPSGCPVREQSEIATPPSASPVRERSEAYTLADLTRDTLGRWHALDFPLRYSGDDPHELLHRINTECSAAARSLAGARTIIITFGTAWCFEIVSNGKVAGNCHKLPASEFVRRRMTPADITAMWQPLVHRLRDMGKHVMATVSPIRHLADGLHGNQLSKATLLLAVDALEGVEYFPAYEAVVDDLRDYRFYADDLKHPSAMAVEYIYNIFSQTYFSKETLEEARRRHAARLREAHRPLL